jgi:beta-glucanase (GH16 family)
MFTWRCPTGSCSTSSSNVEEADIEILTKGPRNKIQLTNQPSESASGDTLPQATLNATLPGGVEWSAWNEYRYDWLPDLSSWYVNGVSVGNISFQAPKNPAGLILNMWSNGGSWTGNMSIGAASYLQIQWIEIAYNTSDPTIGSKIKRAGPELLEQASELLTSQVSDQFGPFGELPRFSARLHGNGLVASRAGSSTACNVVCSVDTGVTSAGTPVEVSIAGHEKGRQATQSLVVILALLGLWFMW